MAKEIYNMLKKDIQNKIGREVLYGKDCNKLSAQVYEETQRQISSSTIKRFFGIIKSRFNTSKYTLDTFAIFLGFKDWHHYLNSYDESKYSIPNVSTWDLLKNRIHIVTKLSLSSLKEKTGYDPHQLIFRSFTQKRFNYFLESQKTATMFVAPDGYGKSTSLIQLVEKYFLSPDSKYKNDIVALIDGGIFFNLYSKNTHIEQFHQLLEFKIDSSLGYYFQTNPEQRKGRFWLIIDGVDEIYFDKERYHQFVENLVRLIMANDGAWYKIILTCRPENMDIFTYLIHKNPILKSSWFGVNFIEDNMAEAINIPLYNKKEIKNMLNKLQFKHDYEYLEINHNEILEILSYPYLLSLFAKEFNDNNNVSEFKLLSSYIHKRLHSPPYREEKLILIDNFIELCKRGKETSSVMKKLLLSKAKYILAYRELISYGIFYEYIIPHDTVEYNTYVKFSQSKIFEFFLFEKWRLNKKISTNLFFEIREYYQNNIQLRCNILKLYTRALLDKGNFDLIKQIHTEFEERTKITIDSCSPIPACLLSVVSVIKAALKADDKCRNNLIPWIKQTKVGELLYSSEIEKS